MKTLFSDVCYHVYLAESGSLGHHRCLYSQMFVLIPFRFREGIRLFCQDKLKGFEQRTPSLTPDF